MKKDVKIVTADAKDPCHWCKAGFIYVADQVLGTNRTVLCQEHGDKFIATFHEPEPSPQADSSGV